MVHPHVRSSSDPYDGLEDQLIELIGLVKIVPPLIQQDRERRWHEISGRPVDDPDSDIIDTFGSEAGPEEGYGFAKYDYTIYVAAVVTAWESFREYLIRELYESVFFYNLTAYPALTKLVKEERQRWSRRLDSIRQRYRDFMAIKLTDLPSWEAVAHAHQLRNALVHNLGQYTQDYLKTKMARRPQDEDTDGVMHRYPDDELIDQATIPLSEEFVRDVIGSLLRAAQEIREAVAARNAL
jgi:hypothetical protein